MSQIPTISYWKLLWKRITFQRIVINYHFNLSEENFRRQTSVYLSPKTENGELIDDLHGKFSGLYHRRLNVSVKSPEPVIKIRSKRGGVWNQLDIRLKCMVIPKYEGIQFKVRIKDQTQVIFLVIMAAVGIITLVPINLINYLWENDFTVEPFKTLLIVGVLFQLIVLLFGSFYIRRTYIHFCSIFFQKVHDHFIESHSSEK